MSYHRCHARRCDVPVSPQKLMCSRHWKLVPLRIQQLVCRNYRAGQCDDKKPSAAWLQAAMMAIKAVADAEKRTAP